LKIEILQSLSLLAGIELRIPEQTHDRFYLSTFGDGFDNPSSPESVPLRFSAD
jgi:hypothetical protein